MRGRKRNAAVAGERGEFAIVVVQAVDVHNQLKEKAGNNIFLQY